MTFRSLPSSSCSLPQISFPPFKRLRLLPTVPSNIGSHPSLSPRQAVQAKERGNQFYKSKKFEEALKCYDEAISLDSNEISFYNNKAGKCVLVIVGRPNAVGLEIPDNNRSLD